MSQDEPAGERRDEEAGPGFAPGLEAFNALLRRTLAMSPRPHSEMKLGKPRRRGADTVREPARDQRRTRDENHEPKWAVQLVWEANGDDYTLVSAHELL